MICAFAVVLLAAGAASADGAVPVPRQAEVNSVKLSDSTVPLAARVQAAKAYGDAKSDPMALDALLEGLEARDETVHEAVVEGLRRHAPEQLLVRRALDGKATVAVRVAALAGLRALQPKDAAPALVAGLDAKEEEVRAAVAHAFCVFGAAEAEARLVQSVASDPSKKVRYFAAVALGSLKTPKARAVITSRLKSEPDLVVQDALEQSQTRQNAP